MFKGYFKIHDFSRLVEALYLKRNVYLWKCNHKVQIYCIKWWGKELNCVRNEDFIKKNN